MARPQPRPTDAELAILRVLWERGSCTVRQVHEALADTRETGYTTTLKLMQIMAEKGLVKRDESSRSHVYRAAIQERDTKRRMVADLADRVFEGSAMSLVLHALENQPATAEDLEEIRNLLDRRAKERT